MVFEHLELTRLASIRSRITEIYLTLNYMVQVRALGCQNHSDLKFAFAG
jgi:hypothetical protein